MARITGISSDHIDSMNNYLTHLESGGADLIVNPPESSIEMLFTAVFSDGEMITLSLLGGLGAWAVGVFIGQTLKYVARLSR